MALIISLGSSPCSILKASLQSSSKGRDSDRYRGRNEWGNLCKTVPHPLSTLHLLLIRNVDGMHVYICIEEAKWWMLARAMTSRRRRVFSSQSEAAIIHSTHSHLPFQFSPTPSSVPFTELYFMYLHRLRCEGTTHSAPSLRWAGQGSLRRSDWWVWDNCKWNNAGWSYL